MRPKMIFTYKILLIFTILFTSFFYTIFSTDGGIYNIFYPEISTIYSKDFQIREFEKIQIGDSYRKVQQKIGNPLIYNKISNGAILFQVNGNMVNTHFIAMK